MPAIAVAARRKFAIAGQDRRNVAGTCGGGTRSGEITPIEPMAVRLARLRAERDARPSRVLLSIDLIGLMYRAPSAR